VADTSGARLGGEELKDQRMTQASSVENGAAREYVSPRVVEIGTVAQLTESGPHYSFLSGGDVTTLTLSSITNY
jgi:hypothetical protein